MKFEIVDTSVLQVFKIQIVELAGLADHSYSLPSVELHTKARITHE